MTAPVKSRDVERMILVGLMPRATLFALVCLGLAISGWSGAGLAETTVAPSVVAPDAIAVTDPQAIRAVLEEMTVYGRYFDGEDWIEYHLKDGRTAYWEKGCTYPGKWWVTDGQICYAYPNYLDGAPNCFILYQRPGGAVQFVAFAGDGSTYLASSSTEMAPGNAAHLPVGGLSPCVGV
jgi:hypothetical protein